jgi:hypothetical protein
MRKVVNALIKHKRVIEASKEVGIENNDSFKLAFLVVALTTYSFFCVFFLHHMLKHAMVLNEIR